MTIEWSSVVGSTWVTAEAYSAEEEAIYVRFSDGTGWKYLACPPSVWRDFTAEGQSRGKFINSTLKFKPGGKLVD
ncbi:MAG: hypothetical protein DDT34_01769 [Firmicutes bacterium]|nr:hypothetical protein [Bacillota bacterium]